MRPISTIELYSRREIALAAGVSEADVLAALGPAREFVPHDEAVQIGRLLAGTDRPFRPSAPDAAAATIPGGAIGNPQRRARFFAVSTTLHVAMTAGVCLATFDLPRAPRRSSRTNGAPIRSASCFSRRPGRAAVAAAAECNGRRRLRKR